MTLLVEVTRSRCKNLLLQVFRYYFCIGNKEVLSSGLFVPAVQNFSFVGQESGKPCGVTPALLQDLP